VNFSEKLIEWYNLNKRDLPWRNTRDPYIIWLSEIILQQTRVDQGIEYFYQFINKYPNIKILAESDEEKVLKLWQGLGYYSRARNLHSTAQYININYNAVFPLNYDQIIKLKGIGQYTAAAICSFAFNEPYPVVDGNVIRFLSRLKGIEIAMNTSEGKNTIEKLAGSLMDKDKPGLFNQAIMEFGALQCKPQNPDCESCIFQEECFALNKGLVKDLPVKINRVKQKNRFFNYLVISQKDGNSDIIYFKKRVNKDIWKNLYDFPLLETEKKLSSISILKEIKTFIPSANFNIIKVSKEYTHVLTHRIIHARFIKVEINNKFQISKLEEISEAKLIGITKQKFPFLPLPRLIEKFIQENPLF